MNDITLKLFKSGNSYALRLPARLKEQLQLEDGAEVTVDGLRPAVNTNSPVDNSKFIAAVEELQHVVAEDKKRGVGLGMIEDPVAWQREIRKDRPLPGRDP